MDRRRYLGCSAVAAGSILGGCLGTLGTASSESYRHTVALDNVATVPDGAELSIDVDLREDSVTPDRTARIRAATTNEGERRGVSIGDGSCSLFDRTRGKSDPPGLWLHRSAKTEHIDRDGDRWTRDAPPDRLRQFALGGCGTRRYAPDETVENEYLVWDDYQTEGYFDPGTYRFESRVTIHAVDGKYADDVGGIEERFTWGFDLVVEPAE